MHTITQRMRMVPYSHHHGLLAAAIMAIHCHQVTLLIHHEDGMEEST